MNFLAYDPGQDPEDPEPARRTTSTERVTGDQSQSQEVRTTVSDLMAPEEPTAKSRLPEAQPASVPSQPLPEARSLLAFVLVTLLAALAGALFLVSQRTRIPDRSFEKASISAHTKVASPLAAPPVAALPQMLGAPDHPADAGREP